MTKIVSYSSIYVLERGRVYTIEQVFCLTCVRLTRVAFRVSRSVRFNRH